ncbi:ThiF family adenylyltransferase [Mesoplasma tabanidae]|uniref:Heme biosynthesis protein HemY n=1 Tax=Mesoplasma tabanidae TaxID=219745 RepID=A0A2K8P4H0_9MOLU|nr:ThiF family adenylyltransferase [Mesoplasma tabanidae]ATZ21378.1 heme biosynthesis protein HemY [Mesoplasma tabanidae]
MYLLWNLQKHFFKIDKSTLRIGTDDSDCWTIDDSEGIWEKLIKKCDGSLKFLEILDEYEFNVRKIIKNGINLFIEKGLILTLDKPYKSDKWIQNNKSNIFYFNDENINGINFQKKINKTSVTILGLGGGGFTLLEHLICIGVKKINVVDFDKIDYSNLNRQNIWTLKDIGKYKVDVAYEYAKSKDPKISINRSYKKMKSVSDVLEQICESEWVFSCMDEPPYLLQRIVNRACIIKNKPVVFCFCQKNNGRYFFVKKGKGGCVDCLFSEIINEDLYNFIKNLQKSNFKPITAATSYTIQMLISIMVNEWVKTLQNEENYSVIKRIDFNTLELKEIIKWEKNLNCVTCGNSNSSNNKFLEDFFELIKI